MRLTVIFTTIIIITAAFTGLARITATDESRTLTFDNASLNSSTTVRFRYHETADGLHLFQSDSIRFRFNDKVARSAPRIPAALHVPTPERDARREFLNIARLEHGSADGFFKKALVRFDWLRDGYVLLMKSSGASIEEQLDWIRKRNASRQKY